MPLIEWNDKTLSVGVDLLDNQHKMLIHIINKLAKTIESTDENQTVEIFQQLFDYVKYHFSTEEDYFFRLNDLELHQHKQLHQEFIDQLSQIKKNSQNWAGTQTILLEFLTAWLVNHIQYEDRKFIQDNVSSFSHPAI